MGRTPPLLQAVDQLVGFLHDGQVGSRSRCQTHWSKPKRRRAAAILPVTQVPMGMPNSSPRGGAHSRGRLHHHMLGGIGQRRPTPLSVESLLGQRARGAGGDALAAVDAGHFGQAHPPRGTQWPC